MPPLTTESDVESVEGVEEIAPRKKAKTPDDAEMADTEEAKGEDGANQGEEDDDDGEDDGEEEYVVEQILDHDMSFDDGEARYEIKWLGYEKKADRTWETEDNLTGARELLEEYWKTIGGKPIPGTGKAKKRGRQSLPKAVSSESPASKKPKTTATKIANRPKNLKREPSEPLPEIADDWDPPPVAPGAWEEDVVNIDTIEDNEDEKWVYVQWAAKDAEGKWRRSRHKLSTCYLCCPQRMLKFYESHLVFTDRKKNTSGADANGAESTAE